MHKNMRHIFYTAIGLSVVHMAYALSENLSLPQQQQIATPGTTIFASPTAPIVQQGASTQTAVPTLSAKAFVLLDANSGNALVVANPDVRLPPASLTKMMTIYIAMEALKVNRIHLNDPVTISERAWRTSGSKMFVKVGTQVSVQDLLNGIIVDSGNDACVALAEYIAGDENTFANLMNQQAELLGMRNTHFVDSTGLPDPNHYSSARDMAMLGRALVKDFPEYYGWFSQKWFTYNKIKQPNRNRLLWRDPSVDGIKTGHTDEAGFCLVASSLRQQTRLVSTLLGAPTDATRAEDTERLLNYGFRFFESRKMYGARTTLRTVRIFGGTDHMMPIGIGPQDAYITFPAGQYDALTARALIQAPLKAPITIGTQVGRIEIMLKDKLVANIPLIAQQTVQKGGWWQRSRDTVTLHLKQWIGRDGA